VAPGGLRDLRLLATSAIRLAGNVTRSTLVRFLGQAAIWGSSFTLIKLALTDVAPGLLVVSRLVIGAMVLALFARVTRVSLRLSRRAWLHVAVSAVFANVVPYLLLSFGERSVGAGLAGVLIGATPVLTLGIARLALRADVSESGGSRRGLGFALAFVGVVLVVAPWATPGGSLLGAIECFLAALSYAVGYVYVRRFLSPLGGAPVALATTQLVAASVLLIPIAFTVLWRPVAGVSWLAILAIVLLGALSTGFANILYFRLIQDIGAAGAAAVDYVVPVFAVLFGVLLLGEALTWNIVVGGLVVLAGMALAEGRLSRLRVSDRRSSVPPGGRAERPSAGRREPS
jgi:drug/metabolite transporter (DMT)-like permease